MPELISCRAPDLDALRQLLRAGWRIGIVTKSPKIRNTGSAELVDGWAISDEIFRVAAAPLLDHQIGVREAGGGPRARP